MKLHTVSNSAVLALSFSSLIAGCSTYGECAGGACGTDVAITSNVRSLLDQHTELGAPRAIEVQTIHRVVYLNGQVNDGLSRSIAESVALQAPGVVKVVNSIAVEK
jgi:osmotically-inducible protein OsmY